MEIFFLLLTLGFEYWQCFEADFNGLRENMDL